MSEEIIKKIYEIIKKGNSVEIHPSKDGISVFEVKKAIITT